MFTITLLSVYKPSITYAQQNLFNIPSGDITNNKKFFYQHQLNFYTDKIESKSHLVYGLGKGWDAGINLVGKGVNFSPSWKLLHNDNPQKGPLYPVLMGSIQKQFRITEKIEFNPGLQIGYNLSNKVKNKEINYFAYGVFSYHLTESFKIVAGGYKTNNMYVGKGITYGGMFGYELKVAKRWYLVTDWVTGDNDGSVLVMGGTVSVSKRVQLCAGWQVPNINTPKPMAFVFELNLFGWNIM
ncbi:MAG: hypothetical protein H7329_10070 [Opitutaceae bacterium]|nr:hypothetical protein [Cytophagales bacterium]